jgi:hypothetical protein
MSELSPEFRFLRRESIEEPKIDLVQAITSIKRIDSIASFISSTVISIVDKGMSKILAPSSLIGRLCAKILYLSNPHSALQFFPCVGCVSAPAKRTNRPPQTLKVRYPYGITHPTFTKNKTF